MRELCFQNGYFSNNIFYNYVTVFSCYIVLVWGYWLKKVTLNLEIIFLEHTVLIEI